MSQEHLVVDVTRTDGKVVSVDVTVAALLEPDETLGTEDLKGLVYPIGPDVLNPEEAFRTFIANITAHPQSQPVRAVVLEAWRSALLERLHVAIEPPPTPIPYSLTADAAPPADGQD